MIASDRRERARYNHAGQLPPPNAYTSKLIRKSVAATRRL